MDFLTNFTLQALFLVFMFAVAGNALFGIWREFNANRGLTIAQFLALPETKTLKQCVSITIVVVVLYILVNLYSSTN